MGINGILCQVISVLPPSPTLVCFKLYHYLLFLGMIVIFSNGSYLIFIYPEKYSVGLA